MVRTAPTPTVFHFREAIDRASTGWALRCFGWDEGHRARGWVGWVPWCRGDESEFRLGTPGGSDDSWVVEASFFEMAFLI